MPKGIVVPEFISLAPNATMNPLATIEAYNQYFYQATGGTDVVVGATLGITEASMKIKFMAFTNNVKAEQLYIEEQVLSQLNLVIKLNIPATLENEMLSETPKAEPTEIESESVVEPNDVTAETEGRK